MLTHPLSIFFPTKCSPKPIVFQQSLPSISVSLQAFPSITYISTGVAPRKLVIIFLMSLSFTSIRSTVRLTDPLSKFQYLIHELYPTNHHSFLEHEIYGASCLLLAFLDLTTCHLSNLRYINLILSPSPLSLSLSSFFQCWAFYRPTWPVSNITR